MLNETVTAHRFHTRNEGSECLLHTSGRHSEYPSSQLEEAHAEIGALCLFFSQRGSYCVERVWSS